MMFHRSIKQALVAGSLFVTAASYAANPVSGNIQAFLINNDAVSEAPVAQAEPGDVIEYRLVFTNSGESDVFGLNVVNPIPENTTFVSLSASTKIPSIFKVSIDGGETFESTPVKRIETQSDGSQKEVVIPPSMYTHVQWKADKPLLSDGGEHTYSYRVTIK